MQAAINSLADLIDPLIARLFFSSVLIPRPCHLYKIRNVSCMFYVFNQSMVLKSI